MVYWALADEPMDDLIDLWNDARAQFQAFLEVPEDKLPAEGRPPPALRPRVLLIVYNPYIPGRRQKPQTLTDLLGWGDVDSLTHGFIADLYECSGGLVEYQIAERIDVDGWPVKADGFRYDPATFMRCWRRRGGWHEPDAVDYRQILAEFDLLARIEASQIDEVWLFGSPYAGFYESTMVGPGSFWCNSPPIPLSDGISRRFVIMGFNFERGVGEMLESYGHRVESILNQVWRHHHGPENLWEKFILYDKKAPGKANCGWMHYAPNSRTDYDWGNPSSVVSNCDDWLNFPDFQGETRQVDCRDWGSGDMRAHHKWWFQHLPRAGGYTHQVANNWWWYAVDPDAVTLRQ
jgi:hypothetical protein